MPTLIDHERERWGHMTRRQLHTRLRRITVPVKLDNFLHLSREYHDTEMWQLAIARADELGEHRLADLWRESLNEFNQQLREAVVAARTTTMEAQRVEVVRRGTLKSIPTVARKKTEPKVRVIRIKGRKS